MRLAGGWGANWRRTAPRLRLGRDGRFRARDAPPNVGHPVRLGLVSASLVQSRLPLIRATADHFPQYSRLTALPTPPNRPNQLRDRFRISCPREDARAPRPAISLPSHVPSVQAVPRHLGGPTATLTLRLKRGRRNSRASTSRNSQPHPQHCTPLVSDASPRILPHLARHTLGHQRIPFHRLPAAIPPLSRARATLQPSQTLSPSEISPPLVNDQAHAHDPNPRINIEGSRRANRPRHAPPSLRLPRRAAPDQHSLRERRAVRL